MEVNRKSPLYRLLGNPVFANILMLIFLLGGVAGTLTMVRETFPDFELDLVTVNVAYPGADPDEVEEGICRPLEDALEGVADTKRITMIAGEGAASAIVFCNEDADIQDVKDEVKSKVDTISTFPEDAEKPVVTELRFDSNVANLAIWGELPRRQLKAMAQELKDELLAIPGVSQVVMFGDRDYQVSLEISEAKLRQYGLEFSQVSAAVAKSSLNLPAGAIRTRSEEFKIRIVGRKYRASEFEDLVVLAQPDGAMVRLSQVAESIDTFDDDTAMYALFNGSPCVGLVVMKTKKEDTIRVSRAVDEYLAGKRPLLPPSVQVTKWMDMARLIQGRIDLLARNGALGLLLVFLILWLFVELRLSFWVTMGIPISIAGALALMALTGQSINMISLFGLIMVIGIIVDDAIVVGESVYFHRQAGMSAVEAALVGTGEVVWPVFTAVSTTIVAFVPLLFISGIMGKFIGVLPKPVMAALFISLFEALLILPVHLRHLPRPGEAREKRWYHRLNLIGLLRGLTSRGQTFVTQRVYGPTMDRLLRARYMTISLGIIVLMVVFGCVKGGLIKSQFFPASDNDFIHCLIEFPIGTPIEVSERAARQVTEGWRRTAGEFRSSVPTGKDIGAALFAVVGGTMPLDAEPPKVGNHLAHIAIELLPAEERQTTYEELVENWRQNTGPIGGVLSAKFGEMGGGPPGANIEIDLRGRDRKRLVEAQAALQRHLQTYEGVNDINSTYAPGKTELRIALKPAAHALGISLQDVARQLRQGFYGDEVMRVQRGPDEVKIMVRYPQRERQSRGDLYGVRIRTPAGDEAPFEQVAHVTVQAGYANIRREDGQRLVTVRADVGEATNTEQIMEDLFANYLPAFADKHGISARRGQQAQDRVDSAKTMRAGTVFALLVIYLIMATVFKSYLQPALIMLAIPFGLVGAVIGHAIFGVPLSIMSFFGMVALTGVVVNDAIILIVAFNRRIAEGMPFFEALREAGKRRFRAIILTSLTTFFGLFPILMERSFQAQFLIPMAISVAFGVAFSTFATLVVIPCLMVALNDLRRLAHLALHLRFPGREAVEPGAQRLEDGQPQAVAK